MDSRQHARLTNAPARISSKVGGSIMAYGGYITGTNLELLPGKKIVQAWHMQDWPAGHLSRCTFRLERVRGGTRLVVASIISIPPKDIPTAPLSESEAMP